jgi:hypothetical protein
VPDPCDLPTLGRFCDGASDAIAATAGTAFDAVAQRIAEGFAKSAQFALTFWTDVELPTLSATSGPVAMLQDSTGWYSLVIATVALLVAGIRMALTARTDPGRDALRGLLTWVLVAGAGVAAINALGRAGDAFSVWILDRSTGGDLGERIALMTGISATGVTGLGPGLVFLVGFVGILASLAQMMLMLIRVGVVTILAGLLPLAAAGDIDGDRTPGFNSCSPGWWRTCCTSRPPRSCTRSRSTPSVTAPTA